MAIISYKNNVYNYYQIGDKLDSEDPLNRIKITVLNFSHICSQSNEINTKHSHGFLEIFVFKKGKGCLEVDNKLISIKENQLLILDANTEHKQYSISKEDPLIYYNFFIDDLNIAGYKANSLAYMLEGNNSSGYFILDLEEKHNLEGYITQIITELEEKGGAYKIKVKSLFEIMFIDILRRLPLKGFSIKSVKKDTEIKKRMQEIKKYIEQNFMEDITLEYLAKMIFLSKSRMIHLFKNIFAISPLQYLTFIRLEKAKKLLTETDSSITEIANIVGYNNSSYFSEVFIKYLRVTPSDYRKITINNV